MKNTRISNSLKMRNMSRFLAVITALSLIISVFTPTAFAAEHTLSEKIAAVTNNYIQTTITLTNDINENITVPVGKNIKIIGNGHAINGSITFMASDNNAGGSTTAVLENIVLNGSSLTSSAITSQNKKDLTPVKLNLTLKNCSFQNYTSNALNITNAASLVIDGCTFTNNATVALPDSGEYTIDINLYAVQNNKLEITNSTFFGHCGSKGAVRIMQNGTETNSVINPTALKPINAKITNPVKLSGNIFNYTTGSSTLITPPKADLIIGSEPNSDGSINSYTSAFGLNVSGNKTAVRVWEQNVADDDEYIVIVPLLKSMSKSSANSVLSLYGANGLNYISASSNADSNTTAAPTITPTVEPTTSPTAEPTSTPTLEPTSEPTATPTLMPTAEPTATPTLAPTAEPTTAPSATPTLEPTAVPSETPTANPAASVTPTSTAAPTETALPTIIPNATPVVVPEITPEPEPIMTSEPGKYVISIGESENGKLHADKAFAAPGEQVELWFDADFGYTAGWISAVLADGTAIEIINNESESSFTMPSGNVNLGIIFVNKSGDELLNDAEQLVLYTGTSIAEIEEVITTDIQKTSFASVKAALSDMDNAILTLKSASTDEEKTAAETEVIKCGGTLELALDQLSTVTQKYPVNINYTGNGADRTGVLVYVNNQIMNNDSLSLYPGETVTLSTYVNGNASVTGIKVNGTSIGRNGSFVMPSSAANIVITSRVYGYSPNSGLSTNSTPKPTPTRTPRPTKTPEPTSVLPFTDVHVWDWYYDNVLSVYNMGLMNGTSTNIFEPNSETTRAMMVTILHRMEGSPKVTAYTPFYDVPQGTWYTNAVDWAFKNKIVNGVGNSLFAPDASITREEMATMFYRYMNWRGDGPTGAWAIQLKYTDTWSISDWAVEGVMFCTVSKIMQGNDDGSFGPRNTATRAEIAAVVDRTAGKIGLK